MDGLGGLGLGVMRFIHVPSGSKGFVRHQRSCVLSILAIDVNGLLISGHEQHVCSW